MSKILVSGMVSRHCNPTKNHRDVMVSWLLAEALRDLGHEVEHRNPTMTEDYEDFDHVFLGLAALHSIGCNRSYGWLAAYQKAQGRVTLYIDDPDTAKVLSGIRVMHNDPKKLVKPYYVYRLEFSLASETAWHSWLMNGIDLLHDYAWPPVIVPMFSWGDADAYRRSLPNAAEIVPIDFSPYVPEYVGEDEWNPEPTKVWVTEAKPENKWIEQQRPVFDIHYFGKNYNKRPDDQGLAEQYASVWGVLDPGLDNGFFNSRILYAAQARTLYVTKWQNVQALGDAYSMLSDTAAGLTEDQRVSWANGQAMSLESKLWDSAMVRNQLKSLLKEKVSA